MCSSDLSIDSLELYNEAGVPIDERALTGAFARINGIERIKRLTIGWSSSVEHLHFLQAFPGLETLILHGKCLLTLDGLQCFRGHSLEINTGDRRKRNINKITEARITSLALVWAKPDDLEAIERCKALKHITMSRCPRLPFERWRNIPVESMHLIGGDLDELTDTVHLQQLRQLHCHDCRKLERFTGDNSRVHWMIIEACNRLDLQTLHTLPNLEYLTVVSMKNEVPFSAFATLPRLRKLSLQHCKVQFDILELTGMTVSLEELYVQWLKKDIAVELSAHNPGVLVTNGTWSYKNGNQLILK